MVKAFPVDDEAGSVELVYVCLSAGGPRLPCDRRELSRVLATYSRAVLRPAQDCPRGVLVFPQSTSQMAPDYALHRTPTGRSPCGQALAATLCQITPRSCEDRGPPNSKSQPRSREEISPPFSFDRDEQYSYVHLKVYRVSHHVQLQEITAIRLVFSTPSTSLFLLPLLLFLCLFSCCYFPHFFSFSYLVLFCFSFFLFLKEHKNEQSATKDVVRGL